MRRPANLPDRAEKKRPALPLERCLAKTRQSAGGARAAGENVRQHCRLAKDMALGLLRRNPLLERLLPEDAWLAAALHDVGKVCPTFQKKIFASLGLAGNMPELAGADERDEKKWGGHAAVSYAALKDRCSWLAEIAGMHHGREIDTLLSDTSAMYGGQEWSRRRGELIEILAEGRPWPEKPLPGVRLLLAGLTVLADWLASGEEVFAGAEDPGVDVVEKCLDGAGFVRPRPRAGLSFEDVFSFGPNDMQKAFIEEVTGPGLYVLEAPMGLGKTEAALYAAYRMLAAGKASGLYFALPTQLTSDMIHMRVEDFLLRVLEEPQKTVLVHGAAWLRRFCGEGACGNGGDMGGEAAPGGSWFEHGRRGILAPFAVGTIDQALMSVLRVRHAGLRALGLAGKVVILDEVHSYDEYTGTLIDHLVRLLTDYGCTVLVLSATLPEDRRRKLLRQTSEPRAAAAPYPLITALGQDGSARVRPATAPAQRPARIKLCPDEAEAMEEALLRAERGEQVLWIENTVGEAQERYAVCAARAAEMGLETGLLHSRFTPRDRAAIEKEWLGHYGKNSPTRAMSGRLLVGTQVLEQSLDIDADFMVSRLAPTELVLQRLGRLWRHETATRPAAAAREAWILAPDMSAARERPEEAFGKSGHVYAPYTLFRALEVWQGLAEVALPDDIRRLVEDSCRMREAEPSEAVLAARKDLERKIAEKTGMAGLGLSTSGRLGADDETATRLIGQKMVRVLLLEDWNPAERICLLPGGARLELQAAPRGAGNARVAAALAANIVAVPEKLAPPETPGRLLPLLAPFIHEAGERAGKTLRVLLPGPGGRCRGADKNPLTDIYYSAKIGYRKTR